MNEANDKNLLNIHKSD